MVIIPGRCRIEQQMGLTGEDKELASFLLSKVLQCSLTSNFLTRLLVLKMNDFLFLCWVT
jgi:hypothetical protein